MESRKDLPAEAAKRSSYERFAIPYSFKPRLSVVEALIASTIAFLRIFLGSSLFAVWGTFTWTWLAHIHNVILRGILFVPLLALFLVTFAGLMLAISAAVRAVTRWV